MGYKVVLSFAVNQFCLVKLIIELGLLLAVYLPTCCCSMYLHDIDCYLHDTGSCVGLRHLTNSCHFICLLYVLCNL